MWQCEIQTKKWFKLGTMRWNGDRNNIEICYNQMVYDGKTRMADLVQDVGKIIALVTMVTAFVQLIYYDNLTGNCEPTV
jgi:hypothetical protein